MAVAEVIKRLISDARGIKAEWEKSAVVDEDTELMIDLIQALASIEGR